MNKQIELKPCPFCGGEAEITVVKKGFKSIIECKTHYCGFMRHSFNNGDTDENAAVRLATAWNRRANEKQSEGEWISVEDRLPESERSRADSAKITCDSCRANRVCDHARFGYETCGNYIPMSGGK